MKIRRIVPCLILAALTHAAALAQATVEGRVALPKPRPAPVENKRYSLTAKGGSPAAAHSLGVVYLEGPFASPASAPSRQIVQKDLAFVPNLLAVQVGTRVEFPNEDDIDHSIYSTSPAKSFDLGRISPAERPVPATVFDHPGLVTIRCDIHEHMRAQILVLDSPYFVVTGPDGTYRLGGLPGGHYVLKAWLSGKQTLEQPVDLKDGAALTLNFP